ncbi:hypothetical protein IA69_12705 [Massilia sp. JS1662]|nr:hypothetical protein IA69_12705 [Massilia sp. JS1662]
MGAGAMDPSRTLALALVHVGADLESIWDDVAAAGYGQEAAIGRDRMLAFAPTPEAKAQLRAYWRERAMERLSALRGPIDELKGLYSPTQPYRSTLLEALREQAPTLVSPTDVVAPQIEPAIKLCLEDYLNPIHEETVRWSREVKARAIHSAGLRDDPQFDAMPWAGRVQLLRERFAQMLAPHGFTVRDKGRNVVIAERPTTDGRFIYALVDDAGANLGRHGQLSHWIAIHTPRQRLSHDRDKDQSLARFGISDLVPEFHWSARHFQTYLEFCRAVDTTAYAALCIFRKVDAALLP